MKKCIGGCLLIGATILFFSACSGGFFSKVEVKASPTIYAPLGEKEYVISNYASVEKVADQIGTDTGARIFTYDVAANSSDPYTVMLYYPILDTQLNFSSYLEASKIDAGLSEELETQSFTVPSISNYSFPLSASFQDILMSEAATSMAPVSSPVVETGFPATSSVPFNVTATGFSTATFSKGAMDFAISLTAGTANFSLTITSLSLEDSSGTVIATALTAITLGDSSVSSGTASIPLAGKTLPANFRIVAGFSLSGGTALTSRTITFTPSFSADAVVSGATGLNFTHVIPVSITRTLTDSSEFVSATIGTGSVDVTIDGIPAAFTGLTKKLKLSMVQNAATVFPAAELPGAGTAASPYSMVLDGKTLSKDSLTIAGSLTIIGTNASFSGMDGSSLNLTCTTSSSIASFSSLTVTSTASLEQTASFSVDVSDELQTWVTKVELSKVGLDLQVDNQLPSGNPVTVQVSSTAFGISDSASFASQAKTADFLGNDSTTTTFIPKDHDTMDFTVTAWPASYDSGTNRVTLSNVVPGATYTLGGSASLVKTLTKVTVDPASYSGTYPETGTGIDLSDLKKVLSPKLTFASVPMYLYLSVPSSVGFAGSLHLKATYTGESGVVTKDIIGVASSLASITSQASGLSLPAGSVYESELPQTVGTNCSVYYDLAEVINAHPSDLVLSYELDAAALDITDFSIDIPLKAELVLLLPMRYTVAAGGADITLEGLLDGTQTDDLFGREPGEDNSDINDLIRGLVSIKIKAVYENHSGLAAEGLLKEAGTGIEKTLSIGTGSGTASLELTAEDVAKAIGEIPFNPGITLRIPNATGDPISYSMAKGATFKLNLSVVAVTNFDQTIDLNGDN